MDHFVDPSNGKVMGNWWEGEGPITSRTPTVTLENFHRRQEMFRQLGHGIDWAPGEATTLAEALTRITQRCGARFVLEPGLESLPVPASISAGNVREALHALLKPLGLRYEYLDDSSISVRSGS